MLYTGKAMAIMATPKKSSGQGKRKRQRHERPDTHYGKFLRWVMWSYDLNQTQLAEIMGTSQTTVSNWMKGVFDASPQSNALMAHKLGFDNELKAHHSHVFTYGQKTPASQPLLPPEDQGRIDAVQREWEREQEGANDPSGTDTQPG